MRRELSNLVYRVPKLSRRGYGSLMPRWNRGDHLRLRHPDVIGAKFRFHVLCVLQLKDEAGWKVTKLAFPKLDEIGPLFTAGKSSMRLRVNASTPLVPKSTHPHHTRVMQTSPVVLELIKSLREQYSRLGKNKIKPFVDAPDVIGAEGIPSLKQSTIGKVIKRNNLFFTGKSRGRRVRGHGLKRQRQRIKRCPKGKGMRPGYIQLDGFDPSAEGLPR